MMLRLAAAVAIAALAPAANAAALGQALAPEFPIARLVIGLLVCSLVALGAALALRRLLRDGGLSFPKSISRPDQLRPRLRVVETRRLSPHADICRIVDEDKEYLVVLTPGGATLLREAAAGAREQATATQL